MISTHEFIDLLYVFVEAVLLKYFTNDLIGSFASPAFADL